LSKGLSREEKGSTVGSRNNYLGVKKKERGAPGRKRAQRTVSWMLTGGRCTFGGKTNRKASIVRRSIRGGNSESPLGAGRRQAIELLQGHAMARSQAKQGEGKKLKTFPQRNAVCGGRWEGAASRCGEERHLAATCRMTRGGHDQRNGKICQECDFNQGGTPPGRILASSRKKRVKNWWVVGATSC